MKIYFASNIGGGEDKYEVCFLLSGIYKRLFSYHYHKECTGMKLYFAGGENNTWEEAINKAKATKSLYSYFYLDKNNKKDLVQKYIEVKKNIFLDSGGYSAKTQGVDINISEYADFILKYKDKITTYANLDVIGNAEATMKNQRYLESRGLNPLPVFHYGEKKEVLEQLCKEYKYIAIGGLVPIARQKEKLFNFLSECFSITKDKVKVHGFGMTGVETLKKYPFYSVDSTSWLGGSMRAEIYTFNKRWLARVINNAEQWMIFEKYITNLWKYRGIEWKD